VADRVASGAERVLPRDPAGLRAPAPLRPGEVSGGSSARTGPAKGSNAEGVVRRSVGTFYIEPRSALHAPVDRRRGARGGSTPDTWHGCCSYHEIGSDVSRDRTGTCIGIDLVPWSGCRRRLHSRWTMVSAVVCVAGTMKQAHRVVGELRNAGFAS